MKEIIYISTRIKSKCKRCNGTGDMLTENHDTTGICAYLCTTCNGKGFNWKNRLMSREEFLNGKER
tara:strand:- start:196 stop:393 length:198 start_codon:yes stop_codon:yes gene_type:complete